MNLTNELDKILNESKISKNIIKEAQANFKVILKHANNDIAEKRLLEVFDRKFQDKFVDKKAKQIVAIAKDLSFSLASTDLHAFIYKIDQHMKKLSKEEIEKHGWDVNFYDEYIDNIVEPMRLTANALRALKKISEIKILNLP